MDGYSPQRRSTDRHSRAGGNPAPLANAQIRGGEHQRPLRPDDSHHLPCREYRGVRIQSWSISRGEFEPDHLDRVMRYLAQPNISALDIGVSDLAKMLAHDSGSLGARPRSWRLRSCRRLRAYRQRRRQDSGPPRTLRRDPADEPAWETPPFSPQVRNVEGGDGPWWVAARRI